MIEEIRKQHPEETPEQHLKRLKFRTKHLRKRRLWPRLLIAVAILLAVFSWKAYGQVNKVDIQRQNGVQVDATGLPVKVLSCTGCSGTTPFIDSAAFTIAASTLSNIGGTFNDSAAALTTGQAGVVRLTANRAIHFNIRNAAGTEMGTASNPFQVTGANGSFPISGSISNSFLLDATFTTRIPVLGQKAMSGSIPVVVSSDQSTIAFDPQGPDSQGATQTGKPVQNGGLNYSDGKIYTLGVDSSGRQQMAIIGTVTLGNLPTQPFLNATDFNDVTAGTPVNGDLIWATGGKWAKFTGATGDTIGGSGGAFTRLAGSNAAIPGGFLNEAMNVLSPPGAPSITAQLSGGTIPHGTILYVKTAFQNAFGETLPSAESNITTGTCSPVDQCTVTVTAPALVGNATGYTVYSSTQPGQERRQIVSPGCENLAAGVNCVITASGTINQNSIIPPSTNTASDGTLVAASWVGSTGAANSKVVMSVGATLTPCIIANVYQALSSCYPTIQSALDAAGKGGRIYIPGYSTLHDYPRIVTITTALHPQENQYIECESGDFTGTEGVLITTSGAIWAMENANVPAATVGVTMKNCAFDIRSGIGGFNLRGMSWGTYYNPRFFMPTSGAIPAVQIDAQDSASGVGAYFNSFYSPIIYGITTPVSGTIGFNFIGGANDNSVFGGEITQVWTPVQISNGQSNLIDGTAMEAFGSNGCIYLVDNAGTGFVNDNVFIKPRCESHIVGARGIWLGLNATQNHVLYPEILIDNQALEVNDLNQVNQNEIFISSQRALLQVHKLPANLTTTLAGKTNFGSTTTGSVNLQANLATPPTAPTIACSNAGGSLAASSYFIKITFNNTTAGETLPSSEVSCGPTVGATGSVTVTAPIRPANSTGYTVYSSTTTGTEKQQTALAACVNITGNCVITVVGAGAVVPAAATASAGPTSVTATGDAGFTSQTGKIVDNLLAYHDGNCGHILGGLTFVSNTQLPMTAATDTKLVEFALPSGFFNCATRAVQLSAAGTYTNPAAQTPTLTYKIKLCTVSGCGSGTVISEVSFAASAATTASVTNQWKIDGTISSTATGTAGQEAHAMLALVLGATGGLVSTFTTDTNTAVSATIDQTAALFIDIMLNESTVAGSTNTAVARLARINQIQ